MFISIRINKTASIICIVLALSALFFGTLTFQKTVPAESKSATNQAPQKNTDFIKWVDFQVTSSAMNKAMKIDIESQKTKTPVNWIDLLAIYAAHHGGNFSSFKATELTQIYDRIKNGESIESLTKDLKYYPYYAQAYNAVLGGFVGDFEIQQNAENSQSPVWTKKYGLKAFSPIAKNYGYSHYDDFGASRSYGYKRKHLGHDMMGNVGTPIIAVESGTVEAIGWNQYGGWRLGIRSFDKKRYYYYAHLRKDHPYPVDLSIGHTVKAGDVIGYLGMTGYSSKENVNNIDTPHLHFGIQLIFDESQKDGNGEIWIDCYEIIKFLDQNTSATVKDELTNERRRKYDFFEKSVENME